jgi:hypothetical protein
LGCPGGLFGSEMVENVSDKPNGIVDKNRGQRPDYFRK